MTGQIEHWATLGRAFEKSPGATLERVRLALQGKFTIDDLSTAEQEAYFDIVSKELGKPTDEQVAYFARLRAQSGVVGLDENGRLVRSTADGRIEVISA